MRTLDMRARASTSGPWDRSPTDGVYMGTIEFIHFDCTFYPRRHGVSVTISALLSRAEDGAKSFPLLSLIASVYFCKATAEGVYCCANETRSAPDVSSEVAWSNGHLICMSCMLPMS